MFCPGQGQSQIINVMPKYSKFLSVILIPPDVVSTDHVLGAMRNFFGYHVEYIYHLLQNESHIQV